MGKKFLMLVVFLVVSWLALELNYANMVNSSNPYIYNMVEKIPQRDVALLLGTNKYLKDNSENTFYTYRIDATAKLYHEKKIKWIIVSGDNAKKGYNEPKQMRDDLINKGVPSSVITLDYAGFRTLDSIVRAKEVFGVSSYTIISQRFHLQRAIYLAQQKGIDAIGFEANNPSYSQFRMKMRELGARAKAFIDILIGVEPRFYGKEKLNGLDINITKSNLT